ncbi:MAG: phosphatidylserine decarboxylase family protein [Deltaproteobacteria bacterium]|nr:phosphatidylserine decarboxylase family protein [Deltaproteobacteria bacterium]
MNKEKRINNRLPLAREGVPFIGIGIGITFILACLGWTSLFLLTAFLTLFVIYFFRDPERHPPNYENAVVTPADGRILEIRNVDGKNNPFGRPSIKISIFMNVFNVHVNRIPIQGTIKKISYHAGKFLSANLNKASEQNENNRVTLETADSKEILIIQIAGLVARRIACWIKEGDSVKIGQRFGLIRFGSRLEVFLPPDSIIIAQVGQKVKAGETIIGRLA